MASSPVAPVKVKRPAWTVPETMALLEAYAQTVNLHRGSSPFLTLNDRQLDKIEALIKWPESSYIHSRVSCRRRLYTIHDTIRGTWSCQ